MENMEVGTLVKEADAYSPTRRGKVIAVLSEDLVVVEWDDAVLEKVSPDDLQVTTPALEDAYQKIKEKVAAATSLLKEANELADDNNTSVADLYYELGLSGLFRELDNAGWSSSSMRC